MTPMKDSKLSCSEKRNPSDKDAFIDVIITCYNEGQYIEDTLRSVLDQTAAKRIQSITIVDDGSTEATVQILKRLEALDPRITIEFGPGGKGISAQRNLAIGKGTAAYVAILDGDDIWEPEKLACQTALLDQEDVLGLVYSDYYAFADGDPGSERRANAADLSQAKNQTQAYFLCDPPILPSATIIRRKVFESSGGFDEGIRMFEEADLWIRVSCISRFGFVNKPLTKKRYHRSSLTGANLDVMPDHVAIALGAIKFDPDLLRFVPRRLAERARKLGNQHYLLGNPAAARKLLKLSIALYAFNPRTWASYLVVCLIPQLSYRLLKPRLQARRRALGFGESAGTKP